MESEGPYFHRCGTPGEKSNCTACAYEEGRKLVDRHESLVDDFKELLEIAEDLYVGCEHHLARCSFVDWKKARGIE